MAGEETTRRWRRWAPPPWVVAAGLMAVAALAMVGGGRFGGDVDRLERAETLSFVLEARLYEQAVLEAQAAATGPPADGAPGLRPAAIREEITAALAELAALLPDDPEVRRIEAAATGWQAAVDAELRLLAAGDLVAANRVNRQRVDPRAERLAGLLRTAGAAYDDAANDAQRRSRSLPLAVAGGTWTVWSRPGAGTVLTASLPRELVAA